MNRRITSYFSFPTKLARKRGSLIREFPPWNAHVRLSLSLRLSRRAGLHGISGHFGSFKNPVPIRDLVFVGNVARSVAEGREGSQKVRKQKEERSVINT